MTHPTIQDGKEKIKYNETFVVSKTIATSPYQAGRIVSKMFPEDKITRYDYASGYDIYGTLLNHDEYYYFRIEPRGAYPMNHINQSKGEEKV